jgi:nicotinamide-nucleotide amidase
VVPVKPLRRAAILAVGSELLTPSRIDTNSLFITEQLNLLGIEIATKSIVGDDHEELAAALSSALSRVDLVVCSGGLGPTDDDVTRDVVARVLCRPLAEDQQITARIQARFAARGLQMPDINRRQAMVPLGARVLENVNGTAPGLWLEEGDRLIVLLPGPPRELKRILTDIAAGPLGDRAPGLSLVRRVLRITGRTESHTEEAVRPLYEEWAQATIPISATILAALGQIELHLSVRSASRAGTEAALAAATAQVADRLGVDLFSQNGRSMEHVVGDLLVEGNLRIAVAESCTGGLITSRLTDVPGSSRYVDRGVVVYGNEAKTELLGISAALIEEHGAVSQEVAVAMAEGIRSRARTDIGVGVTGIAGPGGGTRDKPVGTVAVAAAIPALLRSRVFRFVGDREQVKFQASQAALDMVRRMLLSRA